MFVDNKNSLCCFVAFATATIVALHWTSPCLSPSPCLADQGYGPDGSHGVLRWPSHQFKRGLVCMWALGPLHRCPASGPVRSSNTRNLEDLHDLYDKPRRLGPPCSPPRRLTTTLQLTNKGPSLLHQLWRTRGSERCCTELRSSLCSTRHVSHAEAPKPCLQNKQTPLKRVNQKRSGLALWVLDNDQLNCTRSHFFSRERLRERHVLNHDPRCARHRARPKSVSAQIARPLISFGFGPTLAIAVTSSCQFLSLTALALPCNF